MQERTETYSISFFQDDFVEKILIDAFVMLGD
jgi:hypothetical protein